VKKLILIQIIISFSFCSVAQSNDWKRASNEDGIQAYTRKVSGSKYLEYKIETQISTTIEGAINLITDTKKYKLIFPYLSKVELLKNNTEDSYDVLVVINTPFPARDRIGVYTNQINRSDNEATIQISQNTNLIPDSKYVKIKECYGSWNLKKINEDQIFVSHTFFADPGGTIPPFIINAFALKQPMKTFRIIRKTLESR